jgi:hypothetical protein
MKWSTKYIITGSCLLVLAGLGITSAIYYSWIAVTPGCDASCNEMHNRVSTVMVYGSSTLAVIAVLLVITPLLKRPS